MSHAPDLLGRDCDGGELPAYRDVPDNDQMRVRGNGQRVERRVPSVRATLGEDAAALIEGPRKQAYGPPEDHLDKVARTWTVLLGADITAHQVAICLAAFKIVREGHRPSRENRVDACGYLELAELVADA